MIKTLALKSIKFYQKVFSPDQGIFSFLSRRGVCRFYPSCSQYFYSAVKKYGIFRGTWLGIKRIVKCHPFNPGGVDIP